jgi:hypothetical protein
MVQTNSTLIEWKGVGWIGKFVKPDEGLTFVKPDCSSKWARAFVPLKRHAEESFVPLDAAIEITDCQSHVRDGRQVRHENLLVKGMNRSCGSFLPASPSSLPGWDATLRSRHHFGDWSGSTIGPDVSMIAL